MNSQVHVRIDNRLLHGQVVQFWIGHLCIKHLVVADDEIAANESMPVIYRMALPDEVELSVVKLEALEETLNRNPMENTMVLLRDVAHAGTVVKLTAPIECIVLGNIHATSERTRITDSVYLSDEEVSDLFALRRHNVRIEIQTFPGEVLRLEDDGKGGQRWLRP